MAIEAAEVVLVIEAAEAAEGVSEVDLALNQETLRLGAWTESPGEGALVEIEGGIEVEEVVSEVAVVAAIEVVSEVDEVVVIEEAEVVDEAVGDSTRQKDNFRFSELELINQLRVLICKPF